MKNHLIIIVLLLAGLNGFGQDSKILVSVLSGAPSLLRSSNFDINLSNFESKLTIEEGINSCLMDREPNKKIKYYNTEEIQHDNSWDDKKNHSDKLYQFISEEHKSNSGADGIYFLCTFINKSDTTKFTIWSPTQGSPEHDFLKDISKTMGNENSQVNDYLTCLLK